MKAKFTATHIQHGKNYGDKKETINQYNAVLIYKGKIVNPITARWYMGRSSSASVIYSSVWIGGEYKAGKGISVAGTGSASGYGYCKQSAAFQFAIKDAGVKLYGSPYYIGRDEVEDFKKECHIDGAGMTAVENAMIAICKALGYRNQPTLIRG